MAVKILSVDDESDLELLLTQYFRRKIRKGEYEFSFAHNGLEALAMLLKNKDYDIILSDINMPEMDGLTLLTKVNEMRNPALKCIMVSAYGDMGNIRQAMNNGAFDFATKPIDLDDLSVTIEKAVEQINYIRLSQQEHTQLESIKGDLAVAREIQQAILPRIFPPFPENQHQLDIAASMNAAKDVGGDFYDFFRIDERGGKPSECLTYSNQLLSNESVDCMFVTVFYGIYTISTGEITYCNAGHNPPYILKADGNVEVLPMPQDFLVGAIEGLEYHDNQMKLEPGDTLVMFTDGVNEAMNIDFKEFGDERFEATLKKCAGMDCQQIIDTVKADVAAFVGEAEQSDDITLFTLKRK